MHAEGSSVSAREQVDLIHRVISRRWWLMGLMALISGLCAFGIAKTLPPVYEAMTTVRILKNPSLSDGNTPRQEGRYDSLSAEAMWFTSRRILEPVVERLGLEQTAPTSLFASVVSRLKSKVKGLLGRPDGEGPGSNDVVEKLQDGALKVKQIRGSEVLEIRVNWDDPELAKNIANAAVDVFIERYQEFNQARAENTRDYLENQVDLIKRDLDKSERQLVEFQERTGLISPPGTVPGTSNEGLLDGLMVEKGQVELAQALAEAELDELDSALTGGQSGNRPANPELRTALANPSSLLRTLMTQAVTAEAQAAVASGRYTAKHLATSREVKDLEAIRQQLRKELTRLGGNADAGLNELLLRVQEEEARAGVDKSMTAQREMQRAGLEARIKTYEDQLARLSTRIAEVEKESGGLPKNQQDYLTLTREQRVLEELYKMQRQKLAAAQLDEGTNQYDVRVFDTALAPLKPLKPKPIRMAGVGTLIGLLLGLSLALAAEYLDDSFRTKEEVEAYLGLPVLAELPKVRLPKRRLRIEGAVDGNSTVS